MRSIYLSVAAAALFGLTAGAAPASAVPLTPAGVALPDSGIGSARMSRREMRRMRMERSRMSRRAARQRDSGNARNPSRPLRQQQQQGQTSGGPAR